MKKTKCENLFIISCALILQTVAIVIMLKMMDGDRKEIARLSDILIREKIFYQKCIDQLPILEEMNRNNIIIQRENENKI